MRARAPVRARVSVARVGGVAWVSTGRARACDGHRWRASGTSAGQVGGALGTLLVAVTNNGHLRASPTTDKLGGELRMCIIISRID